MQNKKILALGVLALLSSLLSGCAVISVASAAVSVGSTAVSVAASAAGAAAEVAIESAKVTGKVATKVVGAVVD